MPKLSMDLTSVKKDAAVDIPMIDAKPKVPVLNSTDDLRELTVGLPSPHLARLEIYRSAQKKQMSFSHMPVPLIEAFDAQAKVQGMGKKEFLLHCMRLGGVDLPEYHEIFRQARKE